MGEAGCHRNRRQPFRCLVRARDRAPALHASSADTAKLWSSAVGLLLGSRRGFAALALYLVEGACGMPVFSPALLGGGIAQILGPTGGYLMAYPLVAFVAGYIYETQLSPFRLGRVVIRGCGTRALRWRAQLACRAHSLRYSGAQVWSLLVRFCGSHQGADGRRRRRSLAPTAFFATLNERARTERLRPNGKTLLRIRASL